MELTPKQQASEAVRQANSILVVTGQNPSIDQIATTLGLLMILRKFGKSANAIVSDMVPSQLGFLPVMDLGRNLSGGRDFILKVRTNKAKVASLKYLQEQDSLNIYLKPEQGSLAPSDITFDYGDFHYDIIIAVGVPARNRLDKVFTENPSLFNTPIINIDFHRVNEGYGAINLIDTYAASLGEMMIAMSESLQTGLIDEPIATALLTGIIASTDRFTAPHTTAKALTVAAQMMAAGAKQQTVVKALYGTKERTDRPERNDRNNTPRPRNDGGDNTPRPSAPSGTQASQPRSATPSQTPAQPVAAPVARPVAEPVVAPVTPAPTPVVEPIQAPVPTPTPVPAPEPMNEPDNEVYPEPPSIPMPLPGNPLDEAPASVIKPEASKPGSVLDNLPENEFEELGPLQQTFSSLINS
jgi:hypothetical protein